MKIVCVLCLVLTLSAGEKKESNFLKEYQIMLKSNQSSVSINDISYNDEYLQKYYRRNNTLPSSSKSDLENEANAFNLEASPLRKESLKSKRVIRSTSIERSKMLFNYQPKPQGSLSMQTNVKSFTEQNIENFSPSRSQKEKCTQTNTNSDIFKTKSCKCKPTSNREKSKKISEGANEGTEERTTESIDEGTRESNGDGTYTDCEGWQSSDFICRCKGPSSTFIPKIQSLNVVTLIVTNSPLLSIEDDDLHFYRNSLRELIISYTPSLQHISDKALAGLGNLQALDIHSSPSLTTLPQSLFYLPQLRAIRIVNTGLVSLPLIVYPPHWHIFNIIDLDANKISRLSSRGIRVKTEQLFLNYNDIRTVEAEAFYLSEIGTLSLRGNKNLVSVHEEAFSGVISLQLLDLSETSIVQLPTSGLHTILTLVIQNTPSLLTFPSVYAFSSLIEATLTYPHHCCAFQFPGHHDASIHDIQTGVTSLELEECEHEEELERIKEDSTGTTNDGTENMMSDNYFTSPVNFGSFGALVSDSAEEPKKKSVSERYYDDTTWFGDFVDHHYEEESNEQHEPVEYRDSLDFSGSWSPVDSFDVGTNARTDTPPNDGFHFGTFTPVINKTITKYCGKIVRKLRKVHCTPEPNAFNPCEDIMGNKVLRAAVWIVLVMALLGNSAVVLVLASSRFRMNVGKFLMLNLATADFFMGIYLLIIAIMDAKTQTEYFNYAIFWQSGYGCKMAGFLTVFASELSVFSLTVITSERWYAITYAINLNKRLRLTAAVKIMAVGWLFAILMAALPIFGISDYGKTSICLPLDASTAQAKSYLVCLLLINGVAFIVVCGQYISMYCSIRSHDPTFSQSDLTVAKRMGLLVFTDFACWAPIAFFGFTAVCGFPLIDVPKAKILLVFFYPLNSCANPYLYAILTKQYRRDFLSGLEKYGFCVKTARRNRSSAAASSLNYTFRALNSQCTQQKRPSTFTQVTLCDSQRHHRGSCPSHGEDSNAPLSATPPRYDKFSHSPLTRCKSNEEGQRSPYKNCCHRSPSVRRPPVTPLHLQTAFSLFSEPSSTHEPKYGRKFSIKSGEPLSLHKDYLELSMIDSSSESEENGTERALKSSKSEENVTETAMKRKENDVKSDLKSSEREENVTERAMKSSENEDNVMESDLRSTESEENDKEKATKSRETEENVPEMTMKSSVNGLNSSENEEKDMKSSIRTSENEENDMDSVLDKIDKCECNDNNSIGEGNNSHRVIGDSQSSLEDRRQTTKYIRSNDFTDRISRDGVESFL